MSYSEGDRNPPWFAHLRSNERRFPTYLVSPGRQVIIENFDLSSKQAYSTVIPSDWCPPEEGPVDCEFVIILHAKDSSDHDRLVPAHRHHITVLYSIVLLRLGSVI
jgi:hypothetical protein